MSSLLTNPAVQLLILLPLVVVVAWLLAPLKNGWILSSRPVLVAVCSGVQPGDDEEALTEGDGLGASTPGQAHPGPLGAKASRVASPSVSACLGGANDPWPALPDGWDPVDVELTLMDIEYAEAFRG